MFIALGRYCRYIIKLPIGLSWIMFLAIIIGTLCMDIVLHVVICSLLLLGMPLTSMHLLDAFLLLLRN